MKKELIVLNLFVTTVVQVLSVVDGVTARTLLISAGKLLFIT